MNDLHKREFVSDIINYIEDYMNEHNMKVNGIKYDDNEPENTAIFRDEVFDDLMNGISGIMAVEGINIADNFGDGDDGNLLRLRNEFFALVCKNSAHLPKIGCFNVSITDTSCNETYETQGDKTDVNRSWSDFWEWLIDDIFEMFDIEQPDELQRLTISDISFAVPITCV